MCPEGAGAVLLLAFCGANCVRGIRKNVARPKAVTAYQYRVVVVAVRPRARQGQPLGGEAVRGDAGWCGRVCGGPNLYSYIPSWS